MNGESRAVRYGGTDVPYRLERRRRKTMAISVLPDGSIEVVAPEIESIERIEAVLVRRMPWIRRQRAEFDRHQPPQPKRQYLSGETHWYRGRQYRLKIMLGLASKVQLTQGRILITTTAPRNTERTRELLEEWRRQRARAVFAERLEKVLPRFHDPDIVRPRSVTIRRLSKRWGSMTAGGGLILNLDLINAPTPSIDYVLVHELCHRLEHHHGRSFWELLERVMPDWLERKAKLEATARAERR